MNPSDILIFLWSCPDCTQLKRQINFEKAFSDTLTGKNGAILYMYYAFSNSGFKEILAKFGIEGYETAPLLRTKDGRVMTNLQEIAEYMNNNY